MFGLDGRSLFSNVLGHYYLHYQKNPEKVFSRADLNFTFEIISKSEADVLGICEIYEGQENEIKQGLKKLGYEHFYFGKGHRFKFNNCHVIELIASKIEGKQLEYKMWPVESRLGGGGGFVVSEFPELNVFHVHLALPARNFFKYQINSMQEILSKLKGKTILMGDFNCTYEEIKDFFPDFKLATGRIKTCSLTPYLNRFYNKDVDHIFVKGFEAESIGALEGRSDHKLIYADLK